MGFLHIGGVRTALYNYLFAKQNKGDFILRIEDTDQERFVPEAENYIIESLKWCGITPTEGVGFGDGKYGPYRQSERKDIYIKYVHQLLKSGAAYYAFDTPDELDKMRKDFNNGNGKYDATTRRYMKNSLTLDGEEVRDLLGKNTPYVVRLHVPVNQNIDFVDELRGLISTNSSQVDDKVIYKSKDNLPTYHLANVVDDHLMEITHVIRGEEWIASTPIHVLLYQYFGWNRPSFTHLPLILGPKGKLSKRDGDTYGFPVHPIGFRNLGFSADATVNFLAFLGWNPGDNREIFSIEDLVKVFDIKRIQKGGAKFNFDKAKWFNGQHLQKMNDNLLSSLVTYPDGNPIAMNPNNDWWNWKLEHRYRNPAGYINRVMDFAKSRMNFISDFWGVASYMFVSNPLEVMDDKTKTIITNKWNQKIETFLSNYYGNISQKKFVATEEGYSKLATEMMEASNVTSGEILALFRIALCGDKKGPSVFQIMDILGPDKVKERIVGLITYCQKIHTKECAVG